MDVRRVPTSAPPSVPPPYHPLTHLMSPFSQPGIVLPSAAYLIGAVVFGLVGMLAWRHGGRTERPVVKWSGLVLMLYPYAITETWMLWALGGILCAWLWIQWKD